MDGTTTWHILIGDRSASSSNTIALSSHSGISGFTLNRQNYRKTTYNFSIIDNQYILFYYERIGIFFYIKFIYLLLLRKND